MSKSEKLAAFLRQADKYLRNNVFADPEQVCSAYCDYLAAPDDPPPRPKMPECVARLLDAFERFGVVTNTSDYVKSVRDYYAQPMRLEVGKVYEDENGDELKCVWKGPSPQLGYVCIVFKSGVARYYNADGTNPSIKSNLIREVPNG